MGQQPDQYAKLQIKRAEVQQELKRTMATINYLTEEAGYLEKRIEQLTQSLDNIGVFIPPPTKEHDHG